jgi:hypothetical protein
LAAASPATLDSVTSGSSSRVFLVAAFRLATLRLAFLPGTWLALEAAAGCWSAALIFVACFFFGFFFFFVAARFVTAGFETGFFVDRFAFAIVRCL